MSALSSASATDAPARVAQVRHWYHSIEVAPGVVTPGEFDLRPIAERLPWPDVAGKRCLDVGTSDGFLAFELERRGASEVIAIDIPEHEQWDWEPPNREPGLQFLRHVVGPSMSTGFRVAAELRRSSVRLEPLNVYDLGPERFGQFDVVVCGSLLLHLRDPLRALAAIRSVCREHFLSTNQIDLLRSMLLPRRPLVRLDGTSGQVQWWLPSVAGHRQMLLASGFAIEGEAGPYSIPYGPTHPPPGSDPLSRARSLARRAMTGNDGVPHHAILGRVA